ncbi:MAG TPA: TonB C-terminal domain-containing protein, partial [Telluria sp.]|nr:TonB C-terminal domain-containing protein [Telluria sp.]
YAGRPTAITACMSFATAPTRAASSDLVNRRLVSGLLLSLLFHAILLALQFGVPGLGLPTPFKQPPISIILAPPEPAPSAVAPPVEAPAPAPPAPAPSGMRLVAPAAPAPVVAKAKPAKRRRISRPLPPREPVEAPTPVIAQDQNPNDSFVVPLPKPQEAEQKSTDPKEVQDGADDGAALRAAQLAEEQRQETLAAAAALAKAEQEARLSDQEQQRRDEELALRQRQLDERAAQQQAEAAARQRADELARAQLAQEQLRRQQDDQAARQKADELALKQQAELALKQQAEEQALQQKAEQLALQQKAEALALRQKAEELALRQKAEELALKQNAEELALKQKADQLARQQAEDLARQQAAAARQQADQAARQQAEQAAAAAQRQRDLAAADAPSAGSGSQAAGAGGAGATVPKNLLGSDVGNRVRELTRGIDLLDGTPPPQRARGDDERSGRRVVVGVAERDVPLRMYADSFRQKIERNGGLAFSPMAADRVRIDPLVSVAIRSDGSVEEVTIVRSSGHTETDNAVRRIVRLNARYSSFPPNVAARYDVIEIRRVWSFAETLKLMEELH